MKLYIDGRKLIISGEKKVCFDENSVKGKLNFYRIERPLGFFKREIVLPSYVEAVNNMNVKYKDGLLEIFLNKTKKRIIKVE